VVVHHLLGLDRGHRIEEDDAVEVLPCAEGIGELDLQEEVAPWPYDGPDKLRDILLPVP